MSANFAAVRSDIRTALVAGVSQGSVLEPPAQERFRTQRNSAVPKTFPTALAKQAETRTVRLMHGFVRETHCLFPQDNVYYSLQPHLVQTCLVFYNEFGMCELFNVCVYRWDVNSDGCICT